MFNSYTGFKSATKALHDAIKKNPKMNISELREILASASPFASIAAYKASLYQDYKQDSQQNTALQDDTISVNKENYYALMNTLVGLIDELDLATEDTEVYPEELLDTAREQLSEMNQQYHSKSSNNTTEFKNETKEHIIDEFLSMPDILVACHLNNMKLSSKIITHDLYKGICFISGHKVSDDYILRLLEEYAEDKSEAELRKALSTETPLYVIEASDIVYDLDEEDGEPLLPTDFIYLFTENELDKEQSTFNAVVSLMENRISDTRGYCFLSANARILKCHGTSITEIEAN